MNDELLGDCLEELRQIRELLVEIRDNLSTKPIVEVNTGLPDRLPDHLYKTYHALKALGGIGGAKEVSERTGRARAVESGYLNTLVQLGIVKKARDARRVIFSVASH